MASADTSELPGAIGESSACQSKADGPITIFNVKEIADAKGDVAPPRKETSAKYPLPNGVTWEWEHRTGFRKYENAQIARIEFHYQRGDSKVRLKSGKDKDPRPMEVFFVDMKQYDPVSGNDRNVRRVAEGSFCGNCYLKLKRYILEVFRAWYTSRPYRETLEQYKKRERLLRGDTQLHESEGEAVLYHTEGICQALAKNSTFVGATMFVVMVNALWIAIDLDNNDADIWTQADVGFQIAENAFCVLFTLELGIRFGAFREKRLFYKDKWFVFDAVLVLLMVVESWVIPFALCAVLQSCEQAGGDRKVLGLLRLGRILRLTRMTRLIRSIPELMILLKGILKSFASVFYTLLLLVLMLYVFGIFFRAAAEGTEVGTKFFRTVTHSMWSLAMHGVLLDAVGEISSEIEIESKILMAFFGAFILLSTFCILNMLIGIVCEVINGVKVEEEDTIKDFYLRTNILDILDCYDRSGDKKIDREEFGIFMMNPEAVDAIEKFGTDVDGLRDLADVIFEERTSGGGKLDFDELLDVIKRLQGENIAKVSDVNNLRKFVKQSFATMEDQLHDKLVKRMDDHIASRPSASVQSRVLPSLVDVRLSLMAETKIQRHSSKFTIGELVQQFVPRYGQLVVTDNFGVKVGCELTLGELSAAASVSSAPLRQLELNLMPLQ